MEPAFVLIGLFLGWCAAPLVLALLAWPFLKIFPAKQKMSAHRDPWPEFTEDVTSPFYIQPWKRP